MTVRILSIAGSDSGGGAGIQADIKTITMMGGHAMTALTAITAQNSKGVDAAQTISSTMLEQQIKAVLDDFGVDAIKIGMLGSADNANAVADILAQYDAVPIVFDPVMIATSGAILADDATIAAFDRLIALASIITPNLPELDVLGGEDALKQKANAVLIKGGHFKGANGDDDILTDRLVISGTSDIMWRDARIATPHMHGTGCTLSSAIATRLAHGDALPQAVTSARQYVRLALQGAPSFVAENGPMGHFAARNDAVLDGPIFNQVTIDCTDYAASCDFYTQLGLCLIVDSPPRYARFEAANGTTLSLHAADTVRSSAALYFEFADLDAAVDRLVEKGWKFTGQAVDQAWGWREIWTSDPSGHPICLYYGGENRRYPPWRLDKTTV